MCKEMVGLIQELYEVYKSILERIVATSEIDESDKIFLEVYRKYAFNNYDKKIKEI